MIILSNVVDVQYLNLPLVQVFLHWRSSFFFSSLWACTFLKHAEHSLSEKGTKIPVCAQSHPLTQSSILFLDSQLLVLVFGIEEERKRRTPSCLSCEEPVGIWKVFLPHPVIGNWKVSCFCSGLCFRKRLSGVIASRLDVGSTLPMCSLIRGLFLERLYSVHFLKIQIYKCLLHPA